MKNCRLDTCVTMYLMKKVFLLLMLMIFCIKSYAVNVYDDKIFIEKCKEKKCTKKELKSEKIINQNDLMFLGQKLYLDNYNPLNFNSTPKIIDNSIVVEK